MKNKIKQLIIEKQFEIERLKAKQSTAGALGFHTQCSAFSSEINQVMTIIKELEELIK